MAPCVMVCDESVAVQLSKRVICWYAAVLIWIQFSYFPSLVTVCYVACKGEGLGLGKCNMFIKCTLEPSRVAGVLTVSSWLQVVALELGHN
jgi:hypothetical protein